MLGTNPINNPFSHALHVDNVGLDCRYCHSNVEKAAHSNIPTTETCMNCHKQIKTDSPHIKKLTAHYESGEPIEWIKVHMLLIMCILIIPHTFWLHVFNATAKLIRWMLFITKSLSMDGVWNVIRNLKIIYGQRTHHQFRLET